jgi:hypothetical protein
LSVAQTRSTQSGHPASSSVASPGTNDTDKAAEEIAATRLCGAFHARSAP